MAQQDLERKAQREYAALPLAGKHEVVSRLKTYKGELIAWAALTAAVSGLTIFGAVTGKDAGTLGLTAGGIETAFTGVIVGMGQMMRRSRRG